MTKRSSKAYPRYKNGLYRHWALFVWKLCEVCGKEWRRERGWRFVVSQRHDRYICADCGRTPEMAHDNARSHDGPRSGRPTPPPGPPCIVDDTHYGVWVAKSYRCPTFDESLAMNGYFRTRNEDGSRSIRYFDDTEESWWLPTQGVGFVPNNSFTHWLLESIPDLGPR